MQINEHTEKVSEVVFSDMEIVILKRYASSYGITLQEVKSTMINNSFWSLATKKPQQRETEATYEN